MKTDCSKSERIDVCAVTGVPLMRAFDYKAADIQSADKQPDATSTRIGAAFDDSGRLVCAEIKAALTHAYDSAFFAEQAIQFGPYLQALLRSYAREVFFELVDKLPDDGPGGTRTPSAQATRDRSSENLAAFLLEGFDFNRMVIQQTRFFEKSLRFLPYGTFQVPDAIDCLHDAVRTKKFIHAVVAHLEDLAAQTSRDIRVLEAGCGPLPILSLAAALYSSRVKVVAVESNPVSAAIAQEIVSKFGLSEQISIVSDDANRFVPKFKVDLLISETVDAALQQENFINIFENLKRFIGSGTRVVPEEIVISQSLPTATLPEAPSDPIQLGYKECYRWSPERRGTDLVTVTFEATLSDIFSQSISPIYLQTEFILYVHRDGKERIVLKPGTSNVTRYIPFRTGPEISSDLERFRVRKAIDQNRRIKLHYSYPAGHLICRGLDRADLV